MTINGLHLDILPPSQRRLWDELMDVPEEFFCMEEPPLPCILAFGLPWILTSLLLRAFSPVSYQTA